MDVLLFAAPDLEAWEERAFHPMDAHPRDRSDEYVRELLPEEPGPPGPRARLVATSIWAYSIFPPSLVSGVLRRPVEVGDTVGIHYKGLPLVRLFFAARVIERFDASSDGWWRAGFTYRTLVGHPELGEERFAIEKELATGALRVVLRSRSRPGTLLARCFAPIVRRLQVSASRRALDHLAAARAPPAGHPG